MAKLLPIIATGMTEQSRDSKLDMNSPRGLLLLLVKVTSFAPDKESLVSGLSSIGKGEHVPKVSIAKLIPATA